MKIKKLKNRKFKDILKSFDRYYGFGKLEYIMSINWFNPLLTLWLNFRSFPFSQALKFPVFVYGRPRLYSLTGDMRVEGEVSIGMIRFNQCLPGAPSIMSVQSELYNVGKIVFHGKGFIGTGNKIRVAKNAILDIGEKFKVADMVNIGCFSSISIGDQTRITHRCQILDSNYHYVANFTKKIVPQIKHPIVIGKGCWICNNTSITGGAVLPDFTIVASNSLVGKDFSSIETGSMIGGIPAKYIATGFRKIENKQIEKIINKYYLEFPMGIYAMPNDLTEEICSKM